LFKFGRFIEGTTNEKTDRKEFGGGKLQPTGEVKGKKDWKKKVRGCSGKKKTWGCLRRAPQTWEN